MNAHSTITADTAAPFWHHAPEAQRLIASLRANPPKLVDRVQHFPVTTDRWTEFAHDGRVERLRIIANEAFLAAEAADAEHGALAFLRTQPSVDDILADIGRHERLFLGVVVPPVPLSSFADLREDARHPLIGEAA